MVHKAKKARICGQALYVKARRAVIKASRGFLTSA